MRRLIVALTLSIVLTACSPYMLEPADAAPAPAVCDRACVERIHRTYAYAAAIERARIHRIYAFAHAVEQARLARLAYPAGQCGGSLPPCYVMMRESRGNIRAQNPNSTASGKWQFLDSTWRRIPAASGYAKARHAPEHVQDAAARWLWAGGRGCSHWSAC